MDLKISSDQFTRVQEVVHDTLRFKAKLSIGEDAYGSLRLKNKLSDCWEVFGAAGIRLGQGGQSHRVTGSSRRWNRPPNSGKTGAAPGRLDPKGQHRARSWN